MTLREKYGDWGIILGATEDEYIRYMGSFYQE